MSGKVIDRDLDLAALFDVDDRLEEEIKVKGVYSSGQRKEYHTK